MGGLTLMQLTLILMATSTNKSSWVDGAVTVLNPAGVMQVSLVVDGNSVKVDAPIVNVDVSWKGRQNISVDLPNGHGLDVAVKDGDVLVLMPDFTGDGHGIVVQVNGGNNNDHNEDDDNNDQNYYNNNNNNAPPPAWRILMLSCSLYPVS